MAFFCETDCECWEGDPNIPKYNVILTDLENEILLMENMIHELLKWTKVLGGT